MTKIILTGSSGYDENAINSAVSESLDLLKFKPKKKIHSVIIKPNLAFYWDYSTGETTDPRVVSAIIDWIKEKFGEHALISIAEADASAMRTKYAFKMLGYEEVSKKKGVKLVNLSLGESISRTIPIGKRNLSIPINKTLLDTDLIINVPKIKVHRRVGFTCALKNMFGAISKPRKYSYHNHLHEYIVAANKAMKSDIVLVDGIIVAGKTPKKLGVIVAGDDVLSTDLVVSKAIGYNSSRIPYLKLAIKENIGKKDKINLIENRITIKKIRNEFPRPNYILQKILWSLELNLLKIYAQLSGDIIPPILEE